MNIQERYLRVQALNEEKPVHPVALGFNSVKVYPSGDKFQLALPFRDIPIWCEGDAAWESFQAVAGKVRQRDGQYCLMKVGELPPKFFWGMAANAE